MKQKTTTDVRLTPRGRRMLKEPDGIKPDLLLTLEVMSRIGGHGDDENIDAMVEELIRQFGTAEDALVALKSGEVDFEKVPDDDEPCDARRRH